MSRGYNDDDDMDQVIQVLIAFGIGELALAVIGAMSISHAITIGSMMLLIFGGACLTLFVVAIVVVFTGVVLMWYDDHKKKTSE